MKMENMPDASATSTTGLLSSDVIRATLEKGLSGRFSGQRVLALIPDHTRSLPLPFLFKVIVEILHETKKLDFMIALGTHPPLSEDHINKLVGITAEERARNYKNIKLINHAWDDPAALSMLGIMDKDEIQALSGKQWHPSLPDQVPIRINKAVSEYDQILIIGPTFPHEVVGFSGGAKYLFPGISGAEMINATHWLGALAGVVGTIGIKDTPVRRMIHAAAKRVKTPVSLVALTVDGDGLAGLFIGDVYETWSAAADFSAQRHIRYCEKPYQRVLSCAPPMYDDLWTGAKAMYKVEPAVAIGGEVIIYAPHLAVVSHVHGKYIYEIGYHILQYFLNDWERFKHIPLGVLAHSTHLRGSGVIKNNIEEPNVRVTLASKISSEDCSLLNLGYLDHTRINVNDWKDCEAEGILFIPKAGEMLYQVRKE